MVALLQALCRTNQGLLGQKAHLLRILVQKFGAERAAALYIQHAPAGSVGQHVRHSLDHMTCAVTAHESVHYDRRQRSTPDEQDVDLALDRMEKLDQQFVALATQPDDDICHKPITACFMLSSDTTTEYELPSTLARELGFAAHHAIHHMAMIKRIVMIEGKLLTEHEFPSDFGTAPSTAYHKGDSWKE